MSTGELIRAATQTLIDNVDHLTALDQAIGDGDHGLNMRRGAQAIQDRLPELSAMSLNEALKAMGMTCISTVGGSAGPVFGTLLVTLGRELPMAPPDLRPGGDALAVALDKAIAAVIRLGKAQVGQKTLLDVLAPVQQTLAAGGTGLAERVRQCALDSAQATADMDAVKGRASFLGERAMGHVDPGSRSTALIIAALCDSLSSPSSAPRLGP